MDGTQYDLGSVWPGMNAEVRMVSTAFSTPPLAGHQINRYRDSEAKASIIKRCT